ncbi:ketopantoate reductase family protein [Poseidonocella sp. HB161398]|uniref:ketopantoate reductase family protein n=1 Tax=Poseidonocella sp. HB161398 TaxID=2320855 RepID=UPI001108560B|nr:2-dehydropantoate 2-reductase [Poseidonocella sp. HB161398]
MTPPRIAIIGAGAIGSVLAARLCGAGLDVTLVARGARLDEIARDGIRLADLTGAHHARPAVATALQEPADALFLCVKAAALEPAIRQNLAGIGPQTRVIPLVNGIPWWFFDDLGHAVEAVDPGGRLLSMVPFEQIVGAVTMMTASFGDGGLVSTIPHQLALGPTVPDGPRPVDLADALDAAGIAVDRADYVRPLVWQKLGLNLATNPLSALTGETLAEIAANPASLARATALAQELEALAAAWGARVDVSDGLGAKLARAGDFRTSMLQDAEAGRPLELAPIVHAPLELAAARSIPMPETRRLLADLTARRAA